jgi:hypothetical protein
MEGVPTPDKDDVPKEERDTQTEIAMDYFDRQSRGSKNSKSEANLKNRKESNRSPSEFSKVNTNHDESMNKDAAILNQNSSTAMGTNHHN